MIKINHKVEHFIKNYGLYCSLVLSIIAVGLSGYCLYVLKTTPGGALAGTVKYDKLTNSEIEKMIKAGAPVLGDLKAKVTVVEFADYQCPYCGKYFSTVMPEVQKYIDSGKIRFVYMSFAFLGEESLFAAQAAHCAGDQNKYWQYHDYLYSNQSGENQGAFDVENLKKFAVKLGLNTTDFNSCLDSKKYEKRVNDETALGKKFGVKGTPATFVNDFFINGLQGVSYFTNRIETALGNK